MKKLIVRNTPTKTLAILYLFLLGGSVSAEDGVESAVKAFFAAGKPEVHLRYRFEHVDDDLVPANDA